MRCPICGKSTVWTENPTRPFCSERCQLIDFGNWANEGYSLPVKSTNESNTEQFIDDSSSLFIA